MVSRPWVEVKQAKEAIDRRNGRDIEAVAELARRRTQAYILGDRLAQLRQCTGLTQAGTAERMGVSQSRVDFGDHSVTVSTPEVHRDTVAACRSDPNSPSPLRQP